MHLKTKIWLQRYLKKIFACFCKRLVKGSEVKNSYTQKVDSKGMLALLIGFVIAKKLRTNAVSKK